MVDADTQLAARCQGADNAALELLFRRYVDRVWRYAWLVTRSREAAAEIVQDTFLRVVRSIANFRADSSFSTWLFAITRSASMEHLRRKRQDERWRESSAILRLVPPERASEPDDREADADSGEAVRQAVSELPAAQRDVVILCEFVRMGTAAAAATLGWGESRVKVTLFRARRKLRDMLRGRLEESGIPRADEAVGKK